ncbi:MAG: ATP-binding cassette domain-containing protein [Acidobacteriota bacterium]
MLQIKGLGKAFRGEWLFRSLDSQINERDRIGLVGDNGTGKSTLMKMIAGLMPADEGEVIGARGLTFGYLPQDGLFARGSTLLEEVLSVFESLRVLEKEIRQLEYELADMQHSGSEYERKMERYALITQKFRLEEGSSIEARAGSGLLGLGFSRNDLNRSCEEFSGGWQMRLALAKLLLQKPSLLLLDEPTNHLDLEARNWLEDFLKAYPHALVLVSHDRYFLDSCTERILEIRNRSIYFYKGNYTDFLDQREERIEQLKAAYDAQQKEIARIKAFADKFRYKATKAAQVQSRLKELERMERIEIPPDAKPIRIRFPEGPRTGRTVIELSGVTAGYGDVPVFEDLHYILDKGERIALVGPNGAGKSTFMKILAGRLPLTKGLCKEGHNVIVSYFSQDQEDLLSSEKTVWDEVYSVAPNYIVPQLRNLLGCFLFSGDEIEKPVSVLSGGERSRLVLCKLLLSPANCLLLDEPTNHLDIRSKDILMDALLQYQGTIVFVSHDRYFLDGLATGVLEIGNRTAVPYLGNYEDYVRKKAEMELKQADLSEKTQTVSSLSGQDGSVERSEIRKKKVNPIKIQQMKDKIGKLEAQIHLHETRVAVLNQMLASEELYRDHQLFRSTMQEHDHLQAELIRLMAQWENLNTELDAMQ